MFRKGAAVSADALLTLAAAQGRCIELQRQRPPEIVVLERAGHAIDLGSARSDRLGGVAPCRGRRRDPFDVRARLGQCKREKPRRRLQ